MLPSAAPVSAAAAPELSGPLSNQLRQLLLSMIRQLRCVNRRRTSCRCLASSNVSVPKVPVIDTAPRPAVAAISAI
ncbi:MAG: hypothetical protein ACJ0GC_06985 [Amylibacter sp.]